MRGCVVILEMKRWLGVAAFPLLCIMSCPAEVRSPLPAAEEIAKLPVDGGDEFNRLIFSQSPYLLQHARNPVDWYPWGEAAFEKARKEDKPVFLSIGYTTCHWCHVMEHESFENEEVGAYLNDHFVAIKVDREERPDIDEVYMTVTQAMTGRGGWPMTVIMTPEKKPFFAGTYFPREDRGGRLGILSILSRVNRLWTENREQIEGEAEKVAAGIQGMSESVAGDAPGKAALESARTELGRLFDAEHGGFGSAPKFPVPPNLSLLLRHHDRTGDEEALAMVEKTLKAMRQGGMFDHIGFGFHRYSTDRVWLLPHFEKMLYDQALLALAYLEAHQVTGEAFYRDTAREILTYVRRDMTSPGGGFYSAEDADSEGEEGKFYVWTPDEIAAVLGAEDGALFSRVFSITPDGNFTDEATGLRSGASIPHLRKDLALWASELGREEEAFRSWVSECRTKLFDAREERVHPQKDDKILTDWNGLMVAAFARAARVLDSPEDLETASRAAAFVLEHLRTPEGRLLKRYRAGEAGLTAHLEDYAFLIWGLIELYEAGFNAEFLEEAVRLTDASIEHFWDEEDGGFYMTADDAEPLLVRAKKLYGGAIPSGNAVMALNLVRMFRMTGEDRFREKLDALLVAFGGDVARSPGAFPMLMQTIDFLEGASREVVIAGAAVDDPGTRALLRVVQESFAPRQVVLFRPGLEAKPLVTELSPFTSAQTMEDGVATAYVCQDFTCRRPVTDPDDLRDLLAELVKDEGQKPR